MSADPESTQPAIELVEVSHRYRHRGTEVEALRPIDLTVPAGESLAVVGPSGCGKSTLLRMIAGFIQPTGGEIRTAGRRVTGPGPDRGMVFQQPRLFPWLSVRGNVEFGLKMAGTPRARRRARGERLLDLVGLGDVGGLRPYQLSGGMQQRAAIARALAPDPGVLLLDEPFAALDALTRERLQDELRRLWRLTGKTLVLVTHSVDEAVFLGTRIVVLSARPGRVLLDRASSLPHRDDARELAEFAQLRTEVATAVRSAAG